MSDTPHFEPVRATIADYGGGKFTAHVDRDTMQYPSGAVVVVPEELWDRMLRPLEWQPGAVYSHSRPVAEAPIPAFDLRMWAVEQAVVMGAATPHDVVRCADGVIAYVSGTP